MRRLPTSETPRVISFFWGAAGVNAQKARTNARTTDRLRFKMVGSRERAPASLRLQLEIEMDSQRVLAVLVGKGGKRIGILDGPESGATQRGVAAGRFELDVGQGAVSPDDEVDHGAQRLPQLRRHRASPVTREDGADPGDVPAVLEIGGIEIARPSSSAGASGKRLGSATGSRSGRLSGVPGRRGGGWFGDGRGFRGNGLRLGRRVVHLRTWGRRAFFSRLP